MNYVWKRLQRAAKHSPVVSSPRESGGGILALAEGSGGKTLQAGDDPQGGLTKCIDIERTYELFAVQGMMMVYHCLRWI